LAFSLATNNNALSSSFPKTEGNILPILILVRDFSFYVDTYVKKEETYPKPSSKILHEFIAHDLKERNLSFALPVINQALENGNVLILLDGLDEISPSISEEWIRECIEIFAQRYNACRYLITCRILPYQNPKIELHDKEFSSFELAPFSKSKIVSFTKAWYAEVSNKWPIDSPAKRAGELCRDIERTDLALLAPNPLLLTVIALVHTFDGKLPPVRALLYERSIDILLWRWEQEKFQGYGRSRLQILLEKINCNRDQLRGILSMLAFQSQKKDPVLQSKDSVKVIDQMSLLSVLSELHPDKSLDWANSVVEVMKLRTGLLLEKEKGVFSFPHRTYQEYLAGSYLSQSNDFDTQVFELLKKGNHYYWRDVILLAVGHLVHIHKDFGKPRLLVEALCPDDNKTVVRWHNVMLAGEVLIEIGIQNLITTDHGKRLLNRVTTQLLAGLVSSAFVEKEKSDVGNILSQLGDPRFNTTRYCLPETTGNTIDGFIRVKSKGFFMGAQKDDNHARTNEYGNIDPVNVLNDYWIACYPVTVAQMKCFVDDSGYQNREWWTKLGWSWRTGEFNSDPGDVAMKTLLHRRSKEMRNAPFNWEEQVNYVNHPVVGVNWFEALAYCNWLNAKLHSCINHDEHPINQDGFIVRLPTESEWEMAARGDDGCLFPWGNNTWSQEFANLRASKINRTTSVGIFLKGKTFSGLYDMCGNVWEWMSSMYKLYPYNDFDGRNSIDVSERRVLRGGSWRDDPSSARCCSRLDAYPDMYYDYFGFRIAIARNIFSLEG
jgi:formylglycine-generating enzyme required for sulfatase activity